MILTKKDIPVENLFMIGIMQKHTTRDAFHFMNPRRPFVITRAEALNIIGYFITMADLSTNDIGQCVSKWDPRTGDWFMIEATESRALLHLPIGKVRGPAFMKQTLMTGRKLGDWILSLGEAVTLAASLIRKMGLKPSEIDACVMAIFENPRGQESLDDMVKRAEKTRGKDSPS